MWPEPDSRCARFRWCDPVWATLLFAVTALYVSAQPRNLSPADESVYLYEAKRILAGAVLYRDVFEITTPGWLYLMALLFRLFGVDLATARVGVAVLHGATAVLLYAACRRLRIRPAFSWPPALAYLIVCQAAWPIASQHWLGTLLTVALLLICAALPGARARWALWPGIAIGLLIAVHQQRGVFVGLGVVLWLAADHLLQRRYQGADGAGSLWARLAWLAAGAAVVVVPTAIVIVASAGFAPVWRALIIHPLFNYRTAMHCSWGQIAPLTDAQGSYTFPRLLKYLPLILAVDLVRAAWLAARRAGRDEVRRLALLLFSGAASMLSIAYFPDFIHIAFIAPVFFAAYAENLERAAGGWLDRSPPLRAASWVAGALALLASGLRLQDNMTRSRAAFPFSRDTEFGRVDFGNPVEVRLYDKLHELIGDAPSRELFCYPIVSHFYLMLDADNPTRYQFLLPGYSSPAQLQEVVDVLQQRRLAYIVAFPSALRPDDPIMAYLRHDYEPLTEAGDIGQGIFRRKRSAAS